ncbi:vWA domain-containing protein [Georgenia sp. MJ206]|uniref:vWA domain-containing protein n=1 Tax=Georgenia wangjunii TaxID=3117730 RepID=UPI002F264EF6
MPRTTGVPAAEPAHDEAKLIVRKGGDRAGTGFTRSVTPLVGATFEFYRTGRTSSLSGGDHVGTCTTDGAGLCGVIVDLPSASSAGNHFYAVETGAPSGWTAPAHWGSDSEPYRFATGKVTTNGSTGSRTVTLPATDRHWADARVNPGFPPTCGIDVAVVVDLSNSVADDARLLAQYKAAGVAFVDALSGTASQIAVYTFAGTAPATGPANSPLPSTSVSSAAGAAAVTGKINSLTDTLVHDDGGTNWDRGLHQVAESGETYDVVLFLTDGSPTTYRDQDGTGSDTTTREVEEAVHSANAVKATGARVVAVGIGADAGGTAAERRLALISGPSEGSDYYTTGFDGLAETLEQIASAGCAGTLTVVKEVETLGGDVVDGGAGWTFTTPTPGVSPSSATTDATGAVNVDVTYPQGTLTRAVTVEEPPTPGYSLVPRDGRNAVCRDTVTGEAIAPTNTGDSGFTVDVPVSAVVSCVVRNRELAQDLAVTTTAQPSFDRDYDWTIDKRVRGADRVEVPAGQDATVSYDVEVTPSEPMDAAFVVTGAITVVNGNDVAVSGITVRGDLPGATCSVDGGTGVTLAAEGQLVLPYRCELPSGTPTTTGAVTAMVTWDEAAYPGTGGAVRGMHAVDFADAEIRVTDASVRVTDSAVDLAGYDDGTQVGNTVDVADGPTVFAYDVTWPDVPGECRTYENTATIAEVSASSAATVEVCAGADLVVAATADVRYDRTYGWTIDKSGSVREVEVDATTGTAAVDYAVDVTPDGYTDSDWASSGTVTVTNPNAWQDVVATVSSATTLGGGAVCTVDAADVDPDVPGLQVLVPRNGEVVLDHDCDFSSRPTAAGEVALTVDWDNGQHATPHATARAAVVIGEADWVRTDLDETVTVLDDQSDPDREPVPLGTVTWDDEPQTFSYTLTHDGKRGECGTEYTNRAWLAETGQDDTWAVELCWPTDEEPTPTPTPTPTPAPEPTPPPTDEEPTPT